MPSTVLAPDSHYDHRIWADLPGKLRRSCQVVLYDQHEPVPGWAEPASPASLSAVRRLTPGRRFDVVAASGESAGAPGHAEPAVTSL